MAFMAPSYLEQQAEPWEMRLSPPTLLLFLISLVFALIAMATKLSYVPIPRYLPHQEYWFAITAYMVLSVGVIFRGL